MATKSRTIDNPRVGSLFMNLCVPDFWTHAQVEAFATKNSPTHDWHVVVHEAHCPCPTTSPCDDRQHYMHISVKAHDL